MIQTGLERLLAKPDIIKNRSVALIANQTSVTADMKYSWDELNRLGIRVRRLFSPEHGLFGTEQDQVPAPTVSGICSEVVSLYGGSCDSLVPLDSHLSDVNCVLFDIQDIGARYYTYISTMVMFMKALQGKDIEFIVLDRPNPVGGVIVEGPVLKKGYESFVGSLPVPVRHGLTPGELAMLAHDYFGLDTNLKVIEMNGWRREMVYDDTGLPWVPPSPNIPSLNTAFVYPGICLLEGTNISEGRGTTTPFEAVGAPGINPARAADELNALGMPGVYFRPIYMRPTFNKYCGETIGAVFIHVTERRLFRSFLAGVAVVLRMSEMMEDFRFTTGAYEFNEIHPAFDLLTGSSGIREMILGRKDLEWIASSWEKEQKVFAGIMEEFLLYREH
ncbi:MAG: DUF1343 domain-containing protein [Spirochaetes bacterium]|nr:DUF1343 domain-containing protein [Spirochaetota bacterium]